MLTHLVVGIYFPEIRGESDGDSMTSRIHSSGRRYLPQGEMTDLSDCKGLTYSPTTQPEVTSLKSVLDFLEAHILSLS